MSIRFLLLFITSLAFMSSHAQTPNLFAGTYTSKGSHGIYLLHFNEQTGSITIIDSIKASNPSYIAVRNKGELIYAVQEDAPGTVMAWKRNEATKNYDPLIPEALPTGGDHPCYISINKAGTHAVVANYSGGSVSVFPVNENGALLKRSQLVQHRGHGADSVRQEKPHVHTTVFTHDEKHLLVADLGTDAVIAYPFAPAQDAPLLVRQTSKVRTENGSGPRHLAQHPSKPWLYVMEELSGMVSSYDINQFRFALIDRVQADLTSKKPGSADIHIHPNGRFLYASNRIDANDIAVFEIGQDSGRLTHIQSISSGGKTPRNFTIHPSGKWLLAANQNGNNIVVFKIDNNGKLSATGHELKLSSPVCLQW